MNTTDTNDQRSIVPPSKSGLMPRGSRAFQVNDPELQPAYKLALAHATENGRTFLLYRDFYVGEWDEDHFPEVTLPTRSDMKRARRHFRSQRGLQEAAEPQQLGKLRENLISCEIITAKQITSRFTGEKITVMGRVPKRFRKI